MKLSYKLPVVPELRRRAALLGVAATFALVQPQIAVGLSPEEVGKIAQEITVRIDGLGDGSGAIVGKEGDTYTVLTNCHVIEEPGTYIIVTHRGSSYQVEANQEMCQPGGIDLAVLRFTSTGSYPVANLGDSSQLVVGRKVYGSGWVGIDPVNPERGYRFQQSNITGIQPRAREGYTLVHTNQSRPGMSGGPILDEEGDVVGINGLGFQEPNTGEWEFFGIPINTYKSWQAAVDVDQKQPSIKPVNPVELAIIESIPEYLGLREYAYDTIPLILRECERSGVTDRGQIAYILATAEHESHLGKWMTELASGWAYEGRSDFGNTQPGDGPRYKGRGFVPITGRRSYSDWSDRLGIDLVNNPERAAEPEIAAKIIVIAMRDGYFSSYKLGDYINGDTRDFYNARRIVNRLDRAAWIEAIAKAYYKVLP